MSVLRLVLLPGMDGTGLLFSPLVEALGGALDPVVAAYPGDRTLGYEELLPLARKFLPERAPFLLLGESFSGPLALMLAAERPPGLRAVVLCATFIRNPLPYLPRAAAPLAHPELFRAARPFILAKALVGGYSTPGLLALLRQVHGGVTPAVMAARARAILRVDVARELSACPVPLFYLSGLNDRVVPSRNLRAILKLRPDVTPVQFEGPHLILQAKPGESAAALLQIANSLSLHTR